MIDSKSNAKIDAMMVIVRAVYSSDVSAADAVKMVKAIGDAADASASVKANADAAVDVIAQIAAGKDGK